MKNRLKTAVLLLMALCLVLLSACSGQQKNPEEAKEIPAAAIRVTSEDVYKLYPDAHRLVLSESGATLDGAALEEFDYAWHADPSSEHKDVKGSPAEYYTGTKPETDAAAYIAHDIAYYPSLDQSSFKKLRYDGEQEYAYYYTAEGYTDYIFATLPVHGNDFPSQMMHTEEEAYANPVLHLTKAGTYILEGDWKGQILIDLGDKDDTFTDETAKVTLVLNGANVNCSVAPSIIFSSLYECDNGWEERETHSSKVDTSNAGAVVVIADDTVNNFTGANVYRMLKPKYKDENSKDEIKVQKKARKIDGAFYSCVSMNIDGGTLGTGTLNITSTTFEGLDSELHLTINGGNINIKTQDDGINVNEDDVSVVTVNGGRLTITAGLGAEGDGIDSNGYIAINGGTVIAAASPISDNGLDSSSGTEINGGTVIALGSNMGGSTYTVYVDGKMQYGSKLPSEGPGGQGGFNPWQGGDRPNGNFDPNQGGNRPEMPNGNFDPNQGGFNPGQNGQGGFNPNQGGKPQNL